MSETLRRLLTISPFPLLQDKLEGWLDSYNLNSTLTNVDRCREAMDLNARVQAQLVALLRIIDPAAALPSSAYPYKSSLYPWYPYYNYPYDYLPATTSVLLSQKEREIRNIEDDYERNLQECEEDLEATKLEADELKAELNDTKADLEAEQRKSTSDKMFSESEVSELRAKLRSAEDELSVLRSRSSLVGDYERSLRRLRDDISILTGRRETLSINGLVEPYPLPLTLPLPPYVKSLPRAGSPLALDDLTQRSRQQSLVARFNDMYAIDRLDAMDTLRRFSDDNENNQRIIFAVMQEAFTAARQAFNSFKARVRSNLVSTHLGPETLEEAVQNYINRNPDLYDLPGLVADVVRALNRNPRISLSPDVSYTVIQPFIREACKLAWNMSSLAHPIDLSIATDAELFEDSKYRRSYESEYTAPLVSHHVWPALKQGLNVLLKGEACTRRGASVVSARSRSRTPTRSLSPSVRARSVSPVRALSPSRYSKRARSPSPRRPYSSLSLRASSPVSFRK